MSDFASNMPCPGETTYYVPFMLLVVTIYMILSDNYAYA